MGRMISIEKTNKQSGYQSSPAESGTCNPWLHACKVVHSGRTILDRMMELLRGEGRKQQFLWLNASFKSDLWWWYCFLGAWNSVTMMENNPVTGQEI